MVDLHDAEMDKWLQQVVPVYADKVDADARFPDGRELTSAFDRAASLYLKRRTHDDIKATDEKCNELAAAAVLLERMGPGQTLVYEPRLQNTKKTLDFRIDGPDAPALWVDVKTIAPQWIYDDDDQWQKFESMQEQLPKHAHLVVNMPGVALQARKVRYSMYARTAKIEDKVREMTDDERRTPVSVMFCGAPFDWRAAALEDFADYYLSGKFRNDDWSIHMMQAYMDEKKIAFERSIVGFHCLLRPQFETLPREVGMFVRGPKMFA